MHKHVRESDSVEDEALIDESTQSRSVIGKLASGYRSFLRYWSTNSLLQIILTRRLSNALKSSIDLSSVEHTEKSPLLPEGSSHVQYTGFDEEDNELLLPSGSRANFSSGTTLSITNFKKLERRLRFLQGTRIFTEKLWPTAFTALMLTDLIEYLAYPSERYGNRLWEIFAGISRDSQILSSYLGMELPPKVSYSLPVAALLSAPVFLGVMQLMITKLYYRNKTLKELPGKLDEIEKQNILWSINTALNPFSRSHQALLRAEFALSRTSHLKDAEKSIVKSFEDLATRHRRFTGWIANRALIEAHANRGLQVNVAMPSFKRTPAHYIYFNYLLWSRGQRPKLWADILFPMLSLYWLYTQLRLLQLLGLKIYGVVEFIKNAMACTGEKKLYQFLKAYGDYVCIVCDYEGMLDTDKLYIQRCLNTLLSNTDPEVVLKDLGRLLSIGDVELIDFSQQNFRAWSVSQFHNFLKALEKQTRLNALNFSTPMMQPVFKPDPRFAALNSFLGDRNLSVVDLSGQNLGDVNLLQIFNQTHPIQNLILQGNGLTDSGATQLGANLWSATQILDISNNPLGDPGITAILRRQNSLIVLKVSQSTITQTGFLEILHFAGNQTLTGLWVNHNPNLMIQNWPQVGEYLSGSAMNMLGLDGIGLQDVDMVAFGGLLRNTSLVWVSTGHNQFSAYGFLSFIESTQNTTLRTFIADDNPLTDIAFNQIGTVLGSSPLTQISLNQIQVEQTAWLALMQAVNNSNISGLLLRNNRLTDAWLERTPNTTYGLTLLDLTANPITDDGVITLVKSLPRGQIKQLILSETQITDRTLEVLAEVLPDTGLEILTIARAKLGTGDGLNKLTKVLFNSTLNTLSIPGNGFKDDAVVFLLQHTVKDVPHSDALGVTYNRFASRYLKAHGQPATALKSIDVDDNPLSQEVCEAFDITAPANGIGFFSAPNCTTGNQANLTNLAIGATTVSTQIVAVTQGFFGPAKRAIDATTNGYDTPASAAQMNVDPSIAFTLGVASLALVILLMTLLYRMASRFETNCPNRRGPNA